MARAMGDMVWRVGGGHEVRLDRPRIMTILNVTPDSFSDGGRFVDVRSVVEAAGCAVREGADVLDIGGESTRPGAARVGAREQIDRVVPVIEAIRSSGIDVAMSVDTTLSEVASAAIEAGADAVNDVSACTEDECMLGLVAERGVGLVMMHRLVAPGEDVYSDEYEVEPGYGDVVEEVKAFLGERLEAAIGGGVDAEFIMLDPGLGFGKSVGQNLELVRRTGELRELGRPILSGASRKSFVGAVGAVVREGGYGEPVEPRERLGGSVALSVGHYLRGASMFRVHDTLAQVQGLRAAAALFGLDVGGA